MDNKGFTLTELLVVIAIVALLSVVVIPSVITVNKNINERMYTQKVENIESSAELYASNNDEIFNGADEVTLYVWELINYNYMTIDIKVGEGDCVGIEKTGSDQVKGCVIDPRSKTSMNKMKVLLRKQNIGVIAIFIDDNDPDAPEPTSEDITLTNKVCEALASGSLVGKYGTGENDYCKCNSDRTGFVDNDGQSITASACLIAGGNVNNNWLRYGSSSANWRVLGLYKLPGYTKLSAKIITSDPI